MENKTGPTGTAVDAFTAGIEDVSRREDCRRLVEIMRGATGHPAPGEAGDDQPR